MCAVKSPPRGPTEMTYSVRNASNTRLAICFLAVLFAAPGFTQTFGEITGRVSDATGAAVPGANAILTNTSTNAVRTTLSTDSGDYSFPSVPPGLYNVRIEKPGFKAAATSNV